MKLSRTPLLLALLPLLANATPGDTSSDHPQSQPRITRLAPVRAAKDEANSGSGIDGWGKASLRDTPAAIDVIGRSQIEQRQPRTLSELAREDAALGDNYAPVGYYQNIAIRGYPLDFGTGYRFNNLGMTGEQAIALEDKQQVEVLKGLAGLGAGVIEPGGVVNFVSKRPEDVRELTLGTDSHGSRYVALDAGSWLTPRFGLRANIAWEDIQSYIRHGDGRRNFYALAADWLVSPATRLQLDGNYQTSAQRSASGYMLLGGTRLPAQPDPEAMLGFQPWQQPVAIQSSNLGARLQHQFNDAWQLRLAAGRSRSVIDDNVAFAYGCYYLAECAGLPGNHFGPDGGYDIYDYRNPDDTRVGDSARAVLQGSVATGGIQHALSIGLGSYHRTVTRTPTVNEYVGSGNINAPEPPVFTPSPKQPGPPVRRLDSWQRSAFVLDRLQLDAHWQLLLGASRAQLHELARSKRGALERDTRLQRTLPQAALIWQPDAMLSLYASYSEGLALGKEAPFWTSNDGELLGPRLSRQLEAGSRYRWNERLEFDAALYRIRQPFQYARPDASSAGFTFVQMGEQRHTGMELSARGKLTDQLDVTASLGLLHARATGTGTPAYEGHQLANVPRVRTSLHLAYQLASLPQLSLQGGWRHASANPAIADGSVSAAAWDVFDAGLRWQGQWNQRNLTLQLGIDNLFNRVYWRDVGSAYGDSYLFPGAPRLARLSLRVGL